MPDLIDRQTAIDAVGSMLRRKFGIGGDLAEITLAGLPSAQEERTEERTETHSCDCIERKAAIDALNVGAELLRRVLDDADIVGAERAKYEWGLGLIESYISDMKELPSAQPTLYGYNIEHLELIARVLQKEDLPPERVVEVLTDVGRIVAIVKDEFEEALRKAVEQCRI